MLEHFLKIVGGSHEGLPPVWLRHTPQALRAAQIISADDELARYFTTFFFFLLSFFSSVFYPPADW